MPELPEVETVVRALKQAELIGSRIVAVEVKWTKTVQAPSVNHFIRDLENALITGCRRIGKWIAIQVNNSIDLLVHLRMSGRLFISSSNHEKHLRVCFRLSNGLYLVFYDPRKFGRIALVANGQEYLKDLGPDPLNLDWDREKFREFLNQSKRSIKTLLLDQRVISGLGNIYVDEVLWRSKIHPLTKGYSLSAQQIFALIDKIVLVLNEAIEHQGTSLGKGQANFYRPNQELGTHQHFLRSYGQSKKPCFRCQTPMQKIRVAQRGTTLCPNCQKLS